MLLRKYVSKHAETKDPKLIFFFLNFISSEVKYIQNPDVHASSLIISAKKKIETEKTIYQYFSFKANTINVKRKNRNPESKNYQGKEKPLNSIKSKDEANPLRS